MALYIFDAYGTLFDVHAAVARQAAAIGPTWRRSSILWRAKQLEYSWVRSLRGRYRDFWALAPAQALDFALAAVLRRHLRPGAARPSARGLPHLGPLSGSPRGHRGAAARGQAARHPLQRHAEYAGRRPSRRRARRLLRRRALGRSAGAYKPTRASTTSSRRSSASSRRPSPSSPPTAGTSPAPPPSACARVDQPERRPGRIPRPAPRRTVRDLRALLDA